MPTQTKPYRYQLPAKAIKADCPECGGRHKKTLSRYVDTKTGDALPQPYGRCDRESNCGYHLSPYHKSPSGLSYAEEVNQQTALPPIPKAWFTIAGNLKRKGHVTREGIVTQLIETQGATPEQAQRVATFIFDKSTRPAQPELTVLEYVLPDEVVSPTIGHYERNQFAQLLTRQFSEDKASELLHQFQIGTSSRWPGACVFWLKDQQQRVRAGQVVLFADDWHKARYTDHEGNQKVCISSVSHGLLRRYRERNQSAPNWLTDYHDNAPRWPILFGLHQLATAPADQPVAIVEAPKTAVVCAAYLPGFVWLAVGALSYLNAERLAPLRGRAVMLFPDLSKDGKAFARWSQVADTLNRTGGPEQGYQISVSAYLEENATDEDKAKGLDLADYLLGSPVDNRPYIILKSGEKVFGEVEPVVPCDTYPADWDTILNRTLSQAAPFTTSLGSYPMAPLAFDAFAQLQRIRWCVIPDGIEEADHNPTLIDSPNRDYYAGLLGIAPNELPLYQLKTTNL